jgi:hypothetical protein
LPPPVPQILSTKHLDRPDWEMPFFDKATGVEYGRLRVIEFGGTLIGEGTFLASSPPWTVPASVECVITVREGRLSVMNGQLEAGSVAPGESFVVDSGLSLHVDASSGSCTIGVVTLAGALSGMATGRPVMDRPVMDRPVMDRPVMDRSGRGAGVGGCGCCRCCRCAAGV